MTLAEQYTTGYFEKMPAPVRPSAGAVTTGHPMDMFMFFVKLYI